ASELRKPVLIEGQAGVGKTEIAKVLATALDTELIRLQCYEGLDVNTALYEWNYPKQMLSIKMDEGTGISREQEEAHIFSDAFLLKRPLLRAISALEKSPVLLIDEVDRADEEFEALLLELLSQFQVTIPELGTIRAERRPTIVLTANRTRALSDALRRRCLYHWIGFPSLEREIEIVRTRLPEASDRLVQRGCLLVQRLRAGYYRKAPGVSETIDWLRALTLFGATDLDRDRVEDTLGCLLKDSEDMALFRGRDGEAVYREFGLLADGRTA
ncbi:MAG: hypothetical protein QOF00_3757, partial [Pseudonocardiales bacterium]|nr:hypothetical protein [Pseudonocardiales bacterium]